MNPGANKYTVRSRVTSRVHGHTTGDVRRTPLPDRNTTLCQLQQQVTGWKRTNSELTDSETMPNKDSPQPELDEQHVVTADHPAAKELQAQYASLHDQLPPASPKESIVIQLPIETPADAKHPRRNAEFTLHAGDVIERTWTTSDEETDDDPTIRHTLLVGTAYAGDSLILWEFTDQRYTWIDTEDLYQLLTDADTYRIYQHPFDEDTNNAGTASESPLNNLSTRFNREQLTDNDVFYTVVTADNKLDTEPITITPHNYGGGEDDVSIDRLAVYTDPEAAAEQRDLQRQIWKNHSQIALLIVPNNS